MPTKREASVERYLAHLRSLSFVREVDLRPSADAEVDALIKITTPEGSFRLACEIRKTFLDRTLTNAIITMAARTHRISGMQLLLLSPYIPRQTGERLAESNVNFVDLYGNMRLTLDGRYHVYVLGKRKQPSAGPRESLGPATLQVLLTLLAEPESVNWPVRVLAERAGVGKSLAAQARNRLVAEGVLQKTRTGQYRINDREVLVQKWLSGYGSLLRPRLLIGTYRASTRDPEEFVRHLMHTWRPSFGRWAATGAAGAYALQHFYRGHQTTLFVDKSNEEIRRILRLLPDRSGPVTLLTSFGPVVYGQKGSSIPTAHPWLIYAELLQEDDPRAHEAAEQIREQYLK